MTSTETVAFVTVSHRESPPFVPQIRRSSRGVKGVLSLSCLSAPLVNQKRGLRVGFPLGVGKLVASGENMLYYY